MLQPSPIYIGKTINKQYFVESKNDYILRESTIIQDLKFANAFIGFLFYIVVIC